MFLCIYLLDPPTTTTLIPPPHPHENIKFTGILHFSTYKFMFSCYIGEVRDIFHNFFAPNSDTHDHYIKQGGN